MRRAVDLWDMDATPELLDAEVWEAPRRLSSSDCETETGRDWCWRSARGEAEDDQ